ncbi:family 20 glycosylhydrolase [Pseudactinotalea sp. HY158]|uniref:family 20 glycosylhydrolase n=1 Tax=Pseudactinotalea sp. HY158 TaxID=2654547 RepID=UPI00129C2E69|nr:family 20 glycosylhydrolase [Pseudactinotalea sp. HY158]QGH68302.1 family 20 glycosylhydrolase [Pseudactinotalea sp. HY158]
MSITARSGSTPSTHGALTPPRRTHRMRAAWRHLAAAAAVLGALALAFAGIIATPQPAEAAAGRDVAREGTATAASTDLHTGEAAGYAPGNAIDGDPTTRWGSRYTRTNPDDTYDPTNDWLQVALPAPVVIDHVVLVWEGAASSDYFVQGSNDGETWTELARVTGEGARTDSVAIESEDAFRYVRMQTNNNASKWGLSIFTFEIWDSVDATPPSEYGRDVARDGTATAASTYLHMGEAAGYAPGNAIDGDPTTRWGSRYTRTNPDDTYDPTNDWLQVAVPVPVVIDHVVLVWEGAASSDYFVQGSNDGETWTELARVTGEGARTDSVAIESEDAFRYVRMQTNNNASKWGLSIFAFEIWDGPTPPPPPAGQVVPAPVAQEDLDADAFQLTAASRIVTGDTDLAAVAKQLAERLRPVTGFELPIVDDAPAPADLVLALGTPDTGAEPGYQADQAYELTASAGGAMILGATPNGVFNGTRTILQLLPAWAYGTETVLTDWVVDATHIADFPRIAQRGFMLDSARTFVEVDDVKTVIDRLADLKGNRLHMHLADDEGWRLEIKSWPNLTEYGASWSITGAEQSGFYTQEEFAEIVAYANSKFIEVIPEFDMPGHSDAATASYPEFVCDDQVDEWKRRQKGTPIRDNSRSATFIPLCADKEIVYEFVDDVVREVSAISPSDFIHLGADEVDSSLMSHDKYVSFIRRAEEIVASHGKRLIGWTPSPIAMQRDDSVHQYWADRKNQIPAAANDTEGLWYKRGSDVVISPTDFAYLDYGFRSGLKWGWKGTGFTTEHSYRLDLDNVIDETTHDSQNSLGLTVDQITAVEGALWSETLADGLPAIDYMLWTRLAGLIEKAWTPRAQTLSWPSYAERLGTMGPRWLAAGVNFYADPAVPWTTTIAGLPGTQAEGAGFDGAVARIASPVRGTGSYAATIDWGDGASSTGTIAGESSAVNTAGSLFTVSGTHSYEAAGAYDGTVTVTATGGEEFTTGFTIDASVDSGPAAQVSLVAATNGVGATCTQAEPCSLDEVKGQARVHAQGGDEVEVVLEPGRYDLSDTLEFTEADSGTPTAPVVWRAETPGTVVLSGGTSVTGWRLHDADLGIWSADVPAGSATRQLYVDGELAPVAQASAAELGFTGWSGGPAGYTVSDVGSQEYLQGIDPSQSPKVEFVYDGKTGPWTQSRCLVTDIGGGGSSTTVTMLPTCWDGMTKRPPRAAIESGGLPNMSQSTIPSRVENDPALLSSGEWYLDEDAHTLFYVPRDGEEIADLDIVLPRLERLMTVAGTLTEPVHDLRFEGLQFSFATWLSPSVTGFAEVQSNLHITGAPNQGKCDVTDPPGTCPYGALSQPLANVDVTASENISFVDGSFRNLGGAALSVRYGAKDTLIEGNEFTDISATALYLGCTFDPQPWDASTHTGIKEHCTPDADAVAGDVIDRDNEVVEGTIVRNNVIHSVGLDYKAAPGVTILFGRDLRLVHNEIYDTPYTAITGGIVQGHATDADNPENNQNVNARNEISNNLLYNYMQYLHDGGAIYLESHQAEYIYDDGGELDVEATFANGLVARGNVAFNDGPDTNYTYYDDAGSQFITWDGNAAFATTGAFQGGCSPAGHLRTVNSYASGVIGQYRCSPPALDVTTDNNTAIPKFPTLADVPEAIVSDAGLEPGYADLSAIGTPTLRYTSSRAADGTVLLAISGLRDDTPVYAGTTQLDVRRLGTTFAELVVPADLADRTIAVGEPDPWLRVNETDESMTWDSSWTYQGTRPFGDYQRDIVFAKNNGATAEIAFSGTRFRLYGETNSDQGEIEVSIDGGEPITVDTHATSRSVDIPVYESGELASGEHTVTIVKRSGTYSVLDGYAYVAAPPTGSVTWSATDALTGELLAGTQWQLDGPGGSSVSVTDDGVAPGRFSVGSLDPGEYTLTQTGPAEGYNADAPSQTFTIDAEHTEIALGELGSTPTDEPTEGPTDEPTEGPTDEPTEEPTDEPTEGPTDEPTEGPTHEPTEEPTGQPTEEPTSEPTVQPTGEPTDEPTDDPTSPGALPDTGAGLPIGLSAVTIAVLAAGVVLLLRRRVDGAR